MHLVNRTGQGLQIPLKVGPVSLEIRLSATHAREGWEDAKRQWDASPADSRGDLANPDDLVDPYTGSAPADKIDLAAIAKEHGIKAEDLIAALKGHRGYQRYVKTGGLVAEG